MKKISVFCIIFLLSFLPLSGSVRQKQIERIIKSSETLKGALVAMMAMSPDGDTLVSIRCDDMLVPASNMKLVTTGVALHKLGPGYRFITEIGYDGNISDSVLDGDVIISGGFDPTLGSKDSIATPVEEVFSYWQKCLSDAGIAGVTGLVVGDLGPDYGMRENPKWQMEDSGTYYGTGTSPLSFCENVLRVNVRPGKEVGDSLTIRQMYPQTPWVHFTYDCTTGEKGTGDRLWLYAADYTNEAVLRGTYALAANAKTLLCSNKMPELTCANEFSGYLKSRNIPNSGPASSRVGKGFVVLGKTFSPHLSDIVRATNYDSNNFYAESILRSLGMSVCGRADLESSRVALQKILSSMGVSLSGLNLDDGSGLSRQNYASPSFFCRFLSAMTESDCFPDYLSSIPRVGVSGTVKARLPKLPSGQRMRVFMKSGSMGGIRCYSGYILPSGMTERQAAANPSKLLVFSVMVNNCTASDGALRNVLDEIIAQLLL